jgi:hypothetical protein
MSDERPITAEQALLAVKAAGLDPGKPLTDQLNPPSSVDERTVKGWVTEAVADALGAQGEASARQSASAEPTSAEQRFAERLRDALPDPGWITPGSRSGGGHDAA